MKSWKSEYLKKVIHHNKILQRVSEIKSRGKTIATINGSFDLLHAGHLHILYSASQAADILIVALNSDESIKQYKYSNRPIVPLEYRMQMIAALEFVDFVTSFSETDPRNILSIIKPDVHVNGSEYGDNPIEAETVCQNGGKLQVVKKIPGLSTSQILEKIISSEKQKAG